VERGFLKRERNSGRGEKVDTTMLKRHSSSEKLKRVILVAFPPIVRKGGERWGAEVGFIQNGAWGIISMESNGLR